MKKLNIKQNKKQLDVLIKELLVYFLIMFIIICYYLFIFKYILSINDEIVPISTAIIEEYSEPKSNKVPNIWYKSILDDFFSKFTINSKSIDHKYFTIKNIQSFTLIERNQDILNKSILDNIRSDNINSLVSECENYKEKISFLEIQIHYTRMIHYNLINDLHEILKDVDQWRK